MSTLDLYLVLAVSIICAGTFWCSYFRHGASQHFGRRHRSSGFIAYLAAAAALPLLCAYGFVLATQIPTLNDLGRVLVIAALLQSQWILSRKFVRGAIRHRGE